MVEHDSATIPTGSPSSRSYMDISKLLTSCTFSFIGWLIWYLFFYKKIQSPQKPKANPALAHELLMLVNGDTATARRLIRNVNRSNPGRSVDWCLEKAIHDLERDRH